MLNMVREGLLRAYLSPLLSEQVILMSFVQSDQVLFLVESNVLTGNCLLALSFLLLEVYSYRSLICTPKLVPLSAPIFVLS